MGGLRVFALAIQCVCHVGGWVAVGVVRGCLC